eukprot:RCo049630
MPSRIPPRPPLTATTRAQLSSQGTGRSTARGSLGNRCKPCRWPSHRKGCTLSDPRHSWALTCTRTRPCGLDLGTTRRSGRIPTGRPCRTAFCPKCSPRRQRPGAWARARLTSQGTGRSTARGSLGNRCKPCRWPSHRKGCTLSDPRHSWALTCTRTRPCGLDLGTTRRSGRIPTGRPCRTAFCPKCSPRRQRPGAWARARLTPQGTGRSTARGSLGNRCNPCRWPSHRKGCTLSDPRHSWALTCTRTRPCGLDLGTTRRSGRIPTGRHCCTAFCPKCSPRRQRIGHCHSPWSATSQQPPARFSTNRAVGAAFFVVERVRKNDY